MTQWPGGKVSNQQVGQNGNQRNRLLVLPEVFSGEENFDDWIDHFEDVSAVNMWTDDKKLLWMRVRLTGKAHVALARQLHETQQTYAAVKEALCKCFEPAGKHKLYKAQFESRRKQAGQILTMI